MRRHLQNLIINKDHQAALPLAEQLVENFQNVPIYKTLLGVCHFNLKQRSKAISTICTSQNTAIQYPGITLRQANGYLAMGMPEKAETLLDHILPEIRWPDQYLDVQITAKIAVGRQDDLLPRLCELHTQADAMRSASYLIARIMHANGDYEDAANYAEHAVKSRPELGRYRVLLATIYLDQGRVDDAEEIIEKLPLMMQKRFRKA